MLDRLRDLSGTALLEAMIWHLTDHAKGEDFPDDISAILLEFEEGKVLAP